MTRTLIVALGLCLAFPTPGQADSGAEVIDRMIAAETARYKNVDRLFKLSETLGHKTPEYLERHNGYLVPVPISELLEEQQPNAMANASPEALRDAAKMLQHESGTVDLAMDREMAKAGFGGGMGGLLTASNPEEPWLTGSPGGMMRLYADMLNATADARESIAAEQKTDSDQARRNQETLAAMKSRTRVLGRSRIDGMDTIDLGADDLGYVQHTVDGSFTMESLRMSVNADHFFPIRFRIEGVLQQGEETRPMTIERIDSEFRGHERGCANLILPYASVMRLGGTLTPEQEAELAEAQAQLAELDSQLASMPPAQQEMMKSMMGPQIEMIRNMASGGGIEIRSNVVEVRCNDDMPTAEELARLVN